jgi:hypothetical protein
VSFYSAATKPFLICLVCATIAALGCSREDSFIDFVETDISKSKVDDLSRSMGFITSEVRFEQREFREGVTNGLNRWVSYSDQRLDNVQWEPDKTLAPLVEEYSGLPVCQRIGQYDFLITDPYYLQQSHWISLLTKRLAQSQRVRPFEVYRLAADNMEVGEVERPVDEIFKRLNSTIQSDSDAEKLANAVKVFDWVSRNINLESDRPLSESEIEERILDDTKTGPEAGVPGLGYQRFPWQTMLYGRGDYVERAKLVMLCLRYLNIDSVLLTAGESAEPWVVAVPVGDEYFLFDTRLGLPLPGEQVGSIATLSMVQQKPDLLEKLDLTTDESLADDTKYRVRPDDLESISGLVYASPDSTSKRMKGLQTVLVGENRMLVSYGLDPVLDRLPPMEGVEIKPWDVSFKTHQYRQAIRKALERSDSQTRSKLNWHYQTESYVDGFRPYRTARGRFFQGKFGAVIEERSLNAMQGYRFMIYDDSDIAGLGSDRDMQRRHGITQQDSKQHDQMISSVQGQMRLIRVDSKLFMAQALFDNENETGVRGWLKDLKSTISSDPLDEFGRWSDGINYLLARSYESGREYDQAIENYAAEGLNQTHGNLLRARMLKQLIEKHFGDVAKK